MGKLRNTASICDFIVENADKCFQENVVDNSINIDGYVSCFKKFMQEGGFGEGSINENVTTAIRQGWTEKDQFCKRFSSNTRDDVAWATLILLGYAKNDVLKDSIIKELSTTYNLDLIKVANFFGIKRFVSKDIDYKKSDIISVDGKEWEVMKDFEKSTKDWDSDTLEVLAFDSDRYENRYLNPYELENSTLVKRGTGKTSIEIREEIFDKESEEIANYMKADNVVVCDYVLESLKSASLNKNSSLREYEKYCDMPQYSMEEMYLGGGATTKSISNWYIVSAQIKGEIHLPKQIYDLYTKNHLLEDFSIFKDASVEGGTTIFYDEKERKDFEDRFGRLTKDWYTYVQTKTISSNCLAVFCENELKFIIDAQGYSYARYVFLPCEQTKKISTKDEYAKFGETYKYEFEVDSEGYEVSKYDEKLKQGLIDAIEKILVEKYGLKPIEAKEIKNEVAEVVENVVEEKPKTAKKATKKGGKPKKATKKAMKKVEDKPIFDIGDELDNGWLIVEYLGKGKYKIIDNEGNELVKTEKEIDEA